MPIYTIIAWPFIAAGLLCIPVSRRAPYGSSRAVRIAMWGMALSVVGFLFAMVGILEAF